MDRSRSLLSLAFTTALALGACAPQEQEDDLDLSGDEHVEAGAQAVINSGNLGSTMRVVNSNLCMHVAPQPDGVWRVDQQPCASNSSMWFYARPIPNTGYFSIEANGRCLDVPSSSTVAGVDLQLYPCHKQSNQQFALTATPNGYEITPRSAPLRCLDVENGNSTPGNRLQQYFCNGGTNQRFLIRPTMSENIFDCDSDEILHVGFPVPSAQNPTYLNILNGQVFHFDANQVRWSEGIVSGAGWWDGEKICAAGTTTIEISRGLADRDTFRLRCYK